MSTPDAHSQSGPHRDLGRMLAQLRTDRGLVQKVVARRAEIDGSTLSRLEAGERGVSRDVLDRLCSVLGLTRREQLDVQLAAGLLTEEAARLLADDDLARLAGVITDPGISTEDAALLRQYVRLALAHARALGRDTG